MLKCVECFSSCACARIDGAAECPGASHKGSLLGFLYAQTTRGILRCNRRLFFGQTLAACLVTHAELFAYTCLNISHLLRATRSNRVSSFRSARLHGRARYIILFLVSVVKKCTCRAADSPGYSYFLFQSYLRIKLPLPFQTKRADGQTHAGNGRACAIVLFAIEVRLYSIRRTL